MSKRSNKSGRTATGTPRQAQVPADPGFAEIVGLIRAAKAQAYQAVNTALVDLYWQVGEYISRKLAGAEWGDGVVSQLATYLAETQPGLRGFTRANLFRMRQFYETYREWAQVERAVRAGLANVVVMVSTQGARPRNTSPASFRGRSTVSCWIVGDSGYADGFADGWYLRDRVAQDHNSRVTHDLGRSTW